MKLHYWGTAAFESIPALYCTCPVCERARALQGRNIRARSQAMIDDIIFIDPNPDTNMNSLRYGFTMQNVKAMLVTHGHSDHIYEEDFGILSKGYSHGPISVTVYGSEGALAGLRAQVNAVPEAFEGRLSLQTVKAFEPFVIEEKYTVTPYAAAHGAAPLIYGIEKDGKRLLYAHDTAWFPEENFEYWAKTGTKFDFVSIDCTSANRATMSTSRKHHQGILENIEMRRRMQEIGAADKNTVFCCNHFSHNGIDACYDDFAPIAEKQGFLTSYDGMIVEL